MPIDINELETPDQEKIRLGMEKKRADAEAFVSTESNNNSGQPAIPKSSNFAGISPHDFNPYQTDQQGNIDYGASAARAIPEATVGYIGLKGIQGLGEGLKRTLSGENRGIKVQERQLKLQENQGVKPTVVSEAGIDPETAQKMRFAEEQHIAKLRRDEELHQAKLQANGIKPNEINTVPPALAGSSVELPNTSTPGIQTAPTATGESALNMLPPVNPATPQGSLPGAPNVQATPATLPVTNNETPSEKVIEQVSGTEPKPPVSNQAPIGEISTNPVESGSEANPLHEPGAEAGKTQLEATQESTNPYANVAKEAKLKEGVAHPVTIPEILQNVEGLHPQLVEHLKSQQEVLKNNPKYEKSLRNSTKLQPNEVFIPGVHNLDNAAFNTYGPEGRRELIGKTNEGKVLGSQMGEEFNSKFSDIAKKFAQYREKAGNALPSYEELKAAGKDTKGFGPLGRKVSIGGVLGLATILPSLANAREAAKHGNASEAIEHLKTAIGNTPILGDLAYTSPEELEDIKRHEIKGAAVPRK